MRTTGLLKAGRVALVAASVVALAGVSMSVAAAAVDPIGPAPASERREARFPKGTGLRPSRRAPTRGA